MWKVDSAPPPPLTKVPKEASRGVAAYIKYIKISQTNQQVFWFIENEVSCYWCATFGLNHLVKIKIH